VCCRAPWSGSTPVPAPPPVAQLSGEDVVVFRFSRQIPLVIGLLLLALAGCSSSSSTKAAVVPSSSGTTSSASSATGAALITIQNFAFHPASITVTPG